MWLGIDATRDVATYRRTDSMSGETGTAVQSICLAAKAVREDRERLAK